MLANQAMWILREGWLKATNYLKRCVNMVGEVNVLCGAFREWLALEGVALPALRSQYLNVRAGGKPLLSWRISRTPGNWATTCSGLSVDPSSTTMISAAGTV